MVRFIIFLYWAFGLCSQGEERNVWEFPKDWERIEVGLKLMPTENHSPLRDSKENALHESSGKFTGDHLVFEKDSKSKVSVKFISHDGSFEILRPLPSQILKKIEELNRRSIKESRLNDVRWNPKFRKRFGYRITSMQNGRELIRCGYISDGHTPESFKECIDYLNKLKAGDGNEVVPKNGAKPMLMN